MPSDHGFYLGGSEGGEAEDGETEGALSLFRPTLPQGFMRDAQAGAAGLAEADVNVFGALGECERCSTTDRTDRQGLAGGRKISVQKVTTAVSISDKMRQSRCVVCEKT